jgi:hypothetical protein
MELFKQKAALSKSNVSVLSGDNSVVSIADYYNDNAKTLLASRYSTSKGRFRERIESDLAEWMGISLVLPQSGFLKFDGSKRVLTESRWSSILMLHLPSPNAFKRTSQRLQKCEHPRLLNGFILLRGELCSLCRAITDYYRHSFLPVLTSSSL